MKKVFNYLLVLALIIVCYLAVTANFENYDVDRYHINDSTEIADTSFYSSFANQVQHEDDSLLEIYYNENGE